MDLQLKGKVAIITGGGRHIGRQIALVLAQEGARVTVGDYMEDRANQVVEEIINGGGNAIGVRADVRNMEDVEAMSKIVLSKFGRIDILVNNAATLPPGVGEESRGAPFIQTTKANWDDDIGVCLYGVLNCCKAVLEHMINQRSGKIVNIVSDAGRIGEPGIATYSAAKAGIVGFSKALAKEVGRYCINVNCVAPGATPQAGTRTEVPTDKLENWLRLYPIGSGLGRLGLTSDIANTVVFLCSDASVFITGQVISVSGGYSMVG
jgi:2-hydroxycyclohexanecarboxyl-CoA dehydrogenase